MKRFQAIILRLADGLARSERGHGLAEGCGFTRRVEAIGPCQPFEPQQGNLALLLLVARVVTRIGLGCRLSGRVGRIASPCPELQPHARRIVGNLSIQSDFVEGQQPFAGPALDEVRSQASDLCNGWIDGLGVGCAQASAPHMPSQWATQACSSLFARTTRKPRGLHL